MWIRLCIIASAIYSETCQSSWKSMTYLYQLKSSVQRWIIWECFNFCIKMLQFRWHLLCWKAVHFNKLRCWCCCMSIQTLWLCWSHDVSNCWTLVFCFAVITSSGYSPRSAHQYSPQIYPSKLVSAPLLVFYRELTLGVGSSAVCCKHAEETERKGNT